MKKFLFIFVFIFLCFILVGCSSDNTVTNNSVTNITTENFIYETEKIKNGMSKIQFKYTISADDTNGLLDVVSIEGDCKWKDTNTGSERNP